jgi:hypothetical protein
MTKDQDREAFERAITREGFYVNLTRIGPASDNAGDYGDVIVQDCWTVWQLALAYARGTEPSRIKEEREQPCQE